MLLITKLMNTNITNGISDTSIKECYENHKTSFRHRSHLTTSNLFKAYNQGFNC